MNPVYPRILRDRDNYRRYYLDEEVTVTLSNGHVLTIPKGYRFDAHSVPWVFRLFFPKDGGGNDIYASMVHDFLIDLEMFLRYNRKFQDGEYARLMNEPEYKTSSYRSKYMPVAVRIWGWLKYDLFGDYRGEPKENTVLKVIVIHP